VRLATRDRNASVPARSRPPVGSEIISAAMPLRTISQEITEFEFHISPTPNSSQPQTGVGTEGATSRGGALVGYAVN
jgi:hypothetical protein